MELTKLADRVMRRLHPRLAEPLFRGVRRLPRVRRRLDAEYAGLLDRIADQFRTHVAVPTHMRIPPQGRPRADVLRDVEALRDSEERRWRKGYASGAVYHGDADHVAFLNAVYGLHSQANPLHPDLWPSAAKFEAEVVAMTAHLLGGDAVADEVTGSVTSGGTESILLAMKAYRDRGRTRRITKPEMVVPTTAHAAFDKAAHLLGIRKVPVPVGADYRADVAATEEALSRNTVVVVGSAPSFPHGVIDPIEELAALAAARGIGFHTDACLGGFLLPWAERLGYDVPPFDFRIPGVTSLSADTHKYGYAPKGTSVILYRGRELRRFQYHTVTDWPGGLYPSPTLAGSRPGALSAACWAALVTIGEDGYLEAARLILETAATIRSGIDGIPGLRVLGDPLWVIAFASDGPDIYRVMEHMTMRGWSLNGLHHPPALHLAVTLPHTRPGVAERFLSDLRESVAEVEQQPHEEGTLAPVYGMAAGFPVRGVVDEMLERYLDRLYQV